MGKVNVLRLVCFVLIVCIFGAIFAGCKPREEILMVEKMSWRYSIEIEKEVLCEESGWSLPSEATLLYTRWERYKRKYDSDGDFIGWKYKTKYYYEIMRWKYSRDVVTSEENDTPYYGEPNLADNERISDKSEQYFIHVVNQSGETAVYPLTYDVWADIGLGDSLTVKLSIWGSIKEIISHEKSIEKFD